MAHTTDPIGGIPFEQAGLAQTVWLGLPYPAWLLLVLTAVLGVVLSRTRFGRNACSVLAGVAGIILAFRQGVGDPRVAEGLELSSIVAVVIGGVSILGGRGHLVGVLGGVVLLGVLRNAVSLQRVDGLLQGVITGVVIILAVAVFSRRER